MWRFLMVLALILAVTSAENTKQVCNSYAVLWYLSVQSLGSLVNLLALFVRAISKKRKLENHSRNQNSDNRITF